MTQPLRDGEVFMMALLVFGSTSGILAELLPFGPSVEDSVVPSSSETAGPLVMDSITWPFYGGTQDTIYVNTDGVISFGKNFDESSSRGNRFPLQSNDVLIAPFWDNFDRNGLVYYRYSTSEGDLADVGARIDAGFGCCFTPSLLFVVTWDHVIESFVLGAPEENTLQVILATDTDKMFVLFLYEDIQWGNVGTSRTIIGFNAGDGVRAFTLPLSLSGSLETILAAEETSNMNIPGTYAFRVDQENIAEPAIAVRLSGPDYVEEGDGEVEYEVRVLAGSALQYSITVLVETTLTSSDTGNTHDSATDPENADYSSFEGNFTFSSNDTESSRLFSISIIDDTELEENETFLIFLTVPDAPENVIVETPKLLVTILDNDEEREVTSTYTQPTPGQVSTAAVSEEPTDDSLVIALSVSLGTGFLVFSVVLITICVCKRLRGGPKTKRISLIHDETKYELEESNVYRDGNELLSVAVRKTVRKNVPKHLIIDSCNLQLNEPVGQGEYGIVYKGRMATGFNTAFSQVVAIKTLKGFLDRGRIADLVDECTRMSDLDHPNVLNLLGVCLDGGPAPYLVMPFMFNGSLLAHLKRERENLVLPPPQQLDTTALSVVSTLVGMCLQIAKGMEYLASKKVIHRDLAVRNCMIDLNFVIKVADFGLATTINPSKDYVRQGNMEGMKLPVKWLAPECLTDGVFSEKSDVWAFGVTCWEVFSGGMMPYSGISAPELPSMLGKGYRMERPENIACQDNMFGMMTECWAAKSEDRPAFTDIVVLLSAHLEGTAGYTTLHVDVEIEKEDLGTEKKRELITQVSQ